MQGDLADLSGDELEGGVRRLAASLISEAAFLLSDRGFAPAKTKHDVRFRALAKDERRAAQKWLDGGPAVLPFAEACEILDMDEDGVRRGVERYIAAPDPSLNRRWRNAEVLDGRAIKD